MAENQNELENEFEEIKAKILEEHPEKKDRIELASTIKELYYAVKEDDSETETKPDRTLRVIHEHKLVEEEEDNEDDEGKGGPSIHKGGSNLSKTGGSVPLYAPKRNSIKDPTEEGKSAKDIIDSIVTEKEGLLWKQSKKGLSGKEEERLRVLEAKQRQYWRALGEGVRNRGVQRSYFQAWTCPVCGSFCHTSRCETCGYRQDSKIDKEEQDKWLILRGNKQ